MNTIEQKAKKAIRVAHISDIHFHKLQLNGMLKNRAIPMLAHIHALINKNRKFSKENLNEFLDSIISIDADFIIISGDLTTAGTVAEFDSVQEKIVDVIKKPIIVVPGNHDTFSENKNSRDNFNGFLQNSYVLNSNKLIADGIEKIDISKGSNRWSVICMNQTLHPSIERVRGKFSSPDKLNKILKEDSCRKIVVGHFPLSKISIRRGGLIGNEMLKNTLEENRNCHIYAHGHRHCFSIYRISSRLVSLDSGSCLVGSNYKSYAVYDLYDDHIDIHQIVKGDFWKLQSSFLLNF